MRVTEEYHALLAFKKVSVRDDHELRLAYHLIFDLLSKGVSKRGERIGDRIFLP
jgi:hypothetical protein